MHPTASLTALLALGASVTAFFPSHWIGEEIPARKELIARGIALEPPALFAAIADKDRDTARLLLRSGVDPNLGDERGRTPLMLALEAGMPDLAEALMEDGADLAATDHAGDPVLAYAVRSGEVSIVAAMLDRGVDPNAQVAGGGSVVGEAVRTGRIASAKMLLEAGASKWSHCSEGAPMIFHATRHGADWLVRRLLEGGVKVDVSDGAGDSLTHTLVRGERPNLLRLLWTHGIDLDARNEDGETALHVAVLEGRGQVLPTLLAHGASAGSTHPTGWKPLHLALQRGDAGSLEVLLAHGADPNSTGAQGRTAMDLVVALKSPPEHLRLLLEAGADPSAQGPDGRTPFEAIFGRRDLASARLLLDHEAATGAALYNAVVEGDEEGIDFLLENGVDPDGSFADPPLVAAVRGGHETMVARLLRAGASVEGTGKEGQGALHLAVAMDRADLAAMLLRAGADANEPYAEPATEEFLARVRDVGYMKWQFKRDARITPLMVAADSGNHALARTLMEHGARKNVWTKRKSYYPIGFAARRDDVKMMQLLLDRDPDNEERWIKVDLSEQKAYVYGKGGETILTTRISSGKQGYRTKTGEFVITNKTRHHVSSIYQGAKMPYFQRLSCGDFGFHEGPCPGYAASHGCIRVPQGNAFKLWKLTEPGDRVVIVP